MSDTNDRLRRALEELRADVEAKLLDAEDHALACDRGKRPAALRVAVEDVTAYRAQLELLDIAEAALDEAGTAEERVG